MRCPPSVTPAPPAVLMLVVCLLAASAAPACTSRSEESNPQPAQTTAPPQGSATPSASPTATAGRSKERRTGLASFISKRFEGRKTASGEVYDGRKLVAAHPTYPIGTVLLVTNQENGRSVEVKVIDRSAATPRGPIIDLSRAAAERLDFIQRGTVPVTTEVLEWGPKRVPK